MFTVGNNAKIINMNNIDLSETMKKTTTSTKKQKKDVVCLRCGRKIKNSDSVVLGYGRTCYQKVLEEMYIQRQLF